MNDPEFKYRQWVSKPDFWTQLIKTSFCDKLLFWVTRVKLKGNERALNTMWRKSKQINPGCDSTTQLRIKFFEQRCISIISILFEEMCFLLLPELNYVVMLMIASYPRLVWQKIQDENNLQMSQNKLILSDFSVGAGLVLSGYFSPNICSVEMTQPSFADKSLKKKISIVFIFAY